MDDSSRHRWDLTTAEARDLQRELASRVDTTRPLGRIEVIAASDVSFDRGSPVLYAAVVVVRAGTFELIERFGVSCPATFPYVPGLLSFREIPALLEAFRRIATVPDVVLCDGQGIAHPRRLGLASHLGLWLGRATVGCAKSRLFGEFAEPGPSRGDRGPLTDKSGAVLGAVVRTRARVAPLFVSPGHLCDVEGAVRLVLETSPRYRLPEPSRMAHDYVNEVRRAVKAGRPIPS